jgi:hypothetical protein
VAFDGDRMRDYDGPFAEWETHWAARQTERRAEASERALAEARREHDAAMASWLDATEALTRQIG